MNTINQNQVTTVTQLPQKKFFNIHTNGVGRLSRVRTVQPNKGSSFLACTVEALVGKAGNGVKPKSRFFDVRVSGAEAIKLLPTIAEYANGQNEVYIGFCIGDIWADFYTRTKGQYAGQQGISTKGRLLYVDWVMVDNKLIYEAENRRTEVIPNMSDLTQVDNFFELYTVGAGYLGHIRTEQTKDQQATYLACSIGALVGEFNETMKPENRYFNARIYDANSDVNKLVEGYQEAVLAGSKVLVGFKVHDIWPSTFTYHRGANAGKTGIAFNCQFIDIGWVRVDGQLSYKKNDQQDASVTPIAPVIEQMVEQPIAQASTPAVQVQETVVADEVIVAAVVEQSVQVQEQLAEPVTVIEATETVTTEPVITATVEQSVVEEQPSSSSNAA